MAPFGFSVGDFIAVGILIQTVAKALSESRGSSAHIRSTVQLMSSLSAAISEASAIFTTAEALPPAAIGGAPPSVINGIVTETLLCRQLIEAFLKRSKSYTDALVNGQGARTRREWKKVTWCLFHDKDIHSLEMGLQGHLFALNLYIITDLKYGASRSHCSFC